MFENNNLTFNRFSKLTSPVLLSLGLSAPVFASDYITPPMVSIPAGEFKMGTEAGDALAKPMHDVSVASFQLAKYPVTVAEFRLFVKETGINPASNCKDHLDENWLSSPTDVGTASWDKHRYTYSDYQPVTCVSWQDAYAYADWLNEKTGHTFRLPTEQEWEYATKANTTSQYFWGDDPYLSQACLYGNFADQSGEYFASTQYGASYVGFLDYANCNDGEPYNAIVGLYRPNPFGLYDMVGNVSQFLDTCYYPSGYQQRTKQEMDVSACEFLSHRGSTWHYPPQPHVARGRYKREGWAPGALMGFRLAADAPVVTADASTLEFENKLQDAQTHRIVTRPQIPSSPQNLRLVRLDENNYQLSWQPVSDKRVTGYAIYQSTSQYSHLYGGYFKNYFQLISSVSATTSSLKVSLPETGGSYRVITTTSDLTSLPSIAVADVPQQVVTLPGRIFMNNVNELENVNLRISSRKDSPEPYFLSKMNKGFEQPLVTASFNVVVPESGWYTLNYRGRSSLPGPFFKLWQNNKFLTEVEYTQDIDDKTSNRHRVYLDAGQHTLQLTRMREGWARWSLTWLEFTKESS